MGSAYGACGGCGGIPVPIPYPVGTGIAPIYTPPPMVATTRVFAPPVFSGVVDADPITPGIQSTPGVVTPMGPPRVVGGGPVFGGPGPVFGGPGPVFGGPVGGPVFGGPRYGYGGLSRVGDMDPISPGIQTRPGVITATGPTAVRPF